MPVKLPKVAILLAAYNGLDWIEDQLASILRQSAVDKTIYISVDPSTDGTEQWCATYANEHQQVILLPNAGDYGSASRNFFRLIRDVDIELFDFIAFADQDDLWHVDKLSRAIDSITCRGVDGYSSNVTAFWPDGKTHVLEKSQTQVKWDFLFEAAGPGCTYVITNALASALKSALLEKWEQIQTVSLHDWYFYAFSRSHGFRWYIDPIPSMEYRQHERNQVGANKGFRSLCARFRMIYEGWWFSQVIIIARLVGVDSDPFVKAWLYMGRWGLIKLSFSARYCRRRVRDKVFFFFICWGAALIGSKNK